MPDANLYLDKILTKRGISTDELSEGAEIAYNTALSYRRSSSDLVSKAILGKIADFLKVQPWELFYSGCLGRSLQKIARALGLEIEAPETPDDIRNALVMISEKTGAGVTYDDFTSEH